LSDDQFKGLYYGKQHHEDDVKNVINRASKVGVDRMLIVSGSLKDSYKVDDIVR